jgi:hypothetical protein
LGEEEREEQFFKAKPREDSQIGKIPPPMSSTRKIIAGVAAAAAIAGLWIWHSHADVQSTLWIHNPGPGSVHIFVSGKSDDIEPGELLDVKVPVAKAVKVHVSRGDKKDTPIEVETHDDTKEVTVLDLGESAYVVLDVSPLFREGATVPDTFEIKHTSPKAKIHQLPFGALDLIRAGRELPKKESWEVQAFRSASAAKMYKVCRVDPKRLSDSAGLAASLSKALKAGTVVQEENLTMVPTSTKAK